MQKKLYRNTDSKIIAGVCSGIAEYAGVDPTVVRFFGYCSAPSAEAASLPTSSRRSLCPKGPTDHANRNFLPYFSHVILLFTVQ